MPAVLIPVSAAAQSGHPPGLRCFPAWDVEAVNIKESRTDMVGTEFPSLLLAEMLFLQFFCLEHIRMEASSVQINAMLPCLFEINPFRPRDGLP